MELAGTLILPLVSFLIAFFSSPAGVSGAFLLLPFQVSVLNFTSPSVSSTNFVYNLIAIPSGVYRYAREDRIVWPLVFTIILGTFSGVFVGAYLRVTYFFDPKIFKLFVGSVLLYLGLKVLHSVVSPDLKSKELEKKFKERVDAIKREQMKRLVAGLPKEAVVKTRKVDLKKIEYDFWGETFSFQPLLVFLVTFSVGILSGIYGIGGGTVIAPILSTYFKLPVYTIAGATLLGSFLTSAFGILSYYLTGYPPDWRIGLAFGFGGIFGMYFGARFQKYMPLKAVKVVLSAIVLGVAVNYILQFFGITTP
ncbi:MAG: sulfite exporter TauE/SafE family protein [Archaeoglobaceae archaeon]|nr:sulfite exporter TauE/SafE family protein [Archaeoglobaceae archaeon]MCX8152145.1 sulfite exporter TauE/SafE family protein [Archaeoglobaceae archaeon]MDW8013861.1 sulfite exporter TauE/SafE family protein [Archaeoglobaceae archaeon]